MAGRTNASLNAANKAKNDEFYTLLTDIEKEMRYYRKHFKGATILCNCDDPFESNFFKFFALNFNRLGLKRLIATCYSGSPIAGEQLALFGDNTEMKETGTAYKAVVNEVHDTTGDGGVDMDDVASLFKVGTNELTKLEGNGDFRSKECLDLLDEADIIVTNPPFSLFREYVGALVEHKKRFIIIGNSNAITYKEVFPLIMQNKLWLGVTRNGTGSMWFRVMDDFPVKTGQRVDENGVRYQTIGNSAWFTNLDVKKRHEEMILVKRYNAEDYPHYDNYDAIEVSKVVDIPCDYDGIMGVPITFLGKYNPDQFEIVGMCENLDLYGLKTRVYTSEECHQRYYELFGKRGTYDMNAAGVVNGKKVYQRILIRNKHPEAPKEA